MQLHLKTTAAAPVNPLTDTQRQMVAHAIMTAENATRDLCSKAGNAGLFVALASDTLS